MDPFTIALLLVALAILLSGLRGSGETWEEKQRRRLRETIRKLRPREKH
jgi:50S ribosomal subunit-associated GTPase HflX